MMISKRSYSCVHTHPKHILAVLLPLALGLALPILTLFLLPSLAVAQGGISWQSIGPSEPGNVGQVLIVTSTNTMYAGTVGGGIFKSTDNGVTWTASSTGLTTPDITGLAVHPTTPTLLYAGTFDRGVFKSEDSGNNWTPITNTLTNLNVRAVAVAPTSPYTLYTGTTAGMVFYSLNGGASWITTVISPASDITLLTFSPLTPTTVYAGSAASIPGTGGIHESADGGLTWIQRGPTIDIRGLAIVPTAPYTFYVSSLRNGVRKSSDWGLNWIDTTTNLPLPPEFYSIAVAPTTPYTIYLGGVQKGFFISTDDGATWTAGAVSVQKTIRCITIDPRDSSVMYVGTYGGVFKSTNSGANWSSSSAGIINTNMGAMAVVLTSPYTLYIGTGRGVSKTDNRGATWTQVVSTTYIRTMAVHPTSPYTVYIGTFGDYVYRSVGNDGTWEHIDASKNMASNIRGMAIAPTSPYTIYVADGDTDVVLRSVDGGTTWVTKTLGITLSTMKGVTSLAVNPVTPTIVYAGVAAGPAGGVFKSIDGGDTWAQSNTNLGNVFILSVAVNPTTPTIVYAGTFGGGIYKSINNGSNWTLVQAALDVRALIVNPNNPSIVYAGTYGGGVYESTDGGDTWHAINTGLTHPYVVTLAASPGTSPRSLYAGALGSGVFARIEYTYYFPIMFKNGSVN